MKKLVVLAGAVALAACNSGTTVTTDDGKEVTIEGNGSDGLSIQSKDGEFNVQSGPNAKVALPAGFSVYPGAEIISSVNMDSNGKQVSTLTMNTSAGLAQVVDFYKKQAIAAGVDVSTEIKAGDAVMLGGESKAGMIFGLNAGPADSGGTTAHLSLSEK